MNIWVVDDNSADAFLVRESILETGLVCQVEVVLDGDQLLKMLDALSTPNAELPDAVVLDLHLGKHLATEILRAIRSSAFISHVPIIILTGSSSPYEREETKAFNPSAFFQKPSSLDEVMKVGRQIALVIAQSQDSVVALPAVATV